MKMPESIRAAAEREIEALQDQISEIQRFIGNGLPDGKVVEKTFSWSLEERKKASRRMKRYWKQRKAGAEAGAAK